ncbi:MAG: transcriptional regulator, TetR family, partial [Streptosporangiaceae bacterium]|nr:transcriptional regulator, TetR family [Streptosporangiaceae bacterium]
MVDIDIDSGSGSSAPRKRADARRNEETLLDAASAAFITSGVDVAKAGVGVGTIYRHFPTRADLIVAVYRHQVEACAEAGPALLAN